jgi:hypothetical protein
MPFWDRFSRVEGVFVALLALWATLFVVANALGVEFESWRVQRVGAILGHAPDREEYFMVTWTIATALALVYGLARLAFGGDAVDGLVSRLIDWVLRERHP